MSAHTPAPWRIGDAGLTVFGPPNGNPSPETVAATRNRANARLIAAAPELLAALRDLVAVTQQNYDNRHELAAALDAIERATGGAA
jgi:hypothetical protein